MDLDRKDLKILALKEKIGQLVTDYEDKIAELRAELTIMADTNQKMADQLNERGDDVQEEPEIVAGEVVTD